jgi:hypothetical protein
MEDALKFQAAMPDFPFTYVGGVISRETADEVMKKGFPMLQMGRAVLEDTDFVNKMQADEKHCSGCEHSNFCIGRMYSKSMQCHKSCEDITPSLKKAVAKINAQNNGITNCDFYAGDMKDILNPSFIQTYGHPDVIITDPPRAGMHEDVIKTILYASPQRIVYVSCNPATQARDLNLLDEAYQVIKIQPVDMFPQTQHVENVVLLHKRI